MAKAKTSNYNQALQKITNFKKHHKRLFIAILLLIAFLIAWLIWHRPMTDMLSSLMGNPTPTKSRTASKSAEISQLSPIDDGSGSSTSTNGGGQTSGSTSTTSNGTSRNGTSTSTTTNSSTTNNTYNTSNNGSGGTTPTPEQTGLINAYAQIFNGQREDQLLGLGIGQPNCLVTVVLLGEQKVCTWTEGSASVIVTLLNGTVVSKVKLGF